MREIVSSLYAFMLQIDERIKDFDRKIAAIFKASDVGQRIAKIQRDQAEDRDRDDSGDRRRLRL